MQQLVSLRVNFEEHRKALRPFHAGIDKDIMQAMQEHSRQARRAARALLIELGRQQLGLGDGLNDDMLEEAEQIAGHLQREVSQRFAAAVQLTNCS